MKLTRRGRAVANIAACAMVLIIVTIMGYVGYLEGL
jgi:TRAP-type C4-dicarboxylate transport system permease small subunit